MSSIIALIFFAFCSPVRAAQSPLSVNFNTELYHQTVTGDHSRSFLTVGNYEKTGVDIFYNKVFAEGPTLTSQLNLQMFDDPLLVGKGGRYRASGGFLSLEKAQNYQFQAGFLVPKASRATLTATVLGAGGYKQWNATNSITRLTVIGGQTQPAVDGSQLQRTVAGTTLTELHRGDYGRLKVFGNFYRIDDVTGSAAHNTGLDRLSSYVFSVGSELRERHGLGFDWELAQTEADRSSTVKANGNSIRVSPSFTSEFLKAGANYERNSPRFINPLASVAADTKKIDGNITIGKVNQLTLNSLYTQDGVEGQLAAQTKTQATGASYKVVPFQEDPYWKQFSTNLDYNLSRARTMGTSDSEIRRVSLGGIWSGEAVISTLRGEYAPVRDFVAPANNRDTLRAIWQMTLKLINPKKFHLDPDWRLTIERSRNLATGQWDQAGTASGGFTGSYSEWFHIDFREDFEQRLIKPAGRKIRNDNTSAGVRFTFKTPEPVTIGFSGYRKHFYDSSVNAFGEEEIRGTLSMRF